MGKPAESVTLDEDVENELRKLAERSEEVMSYLQEQRRARSR